VNTNGKNYIINHTPTKGIESQMTIINWRIWHAAIYFTTSSHEKFKVTNWVTKYPQGEVAKILG